MPEKEGFKLGGIATLAFLASLAGDSKEAKAEPSIPGEQEIHDLLLCTYANYDDQLFGSMVNDPKSANDKIYPGNFDDLDKYPEYGSPRTWKGYIFRTTGVFYTGERTYRVYKIIDGKETEVGQLNYFDPSDLVRFISDSGIALASGKFYGLTDTGMSVVDEKLGDSPVSGDNICHGGYVWVKHPDAGAQHKDFLAIMSEDDVLNSIPGNEVPVASEIELPTDGSANTSFGIDMDLQTGEVVVAVQHGFRVAPLPQLDQDGKLPPDFSLTELTFSPYESLGCSIKSIVTDSGYKYFLTGMADSIIVVTPEGTKYTIGKNQLGAGGTIYEMLKLDSGGIYVIFNDDFNQPPVSLVPATDPLKFMAPNLPFEMIVDEPTGYTKYTVDDGCTKYQGSTDPCEGVVCESANQCKDATCVDGGCVEQNKPDDTPCDDNNVCTPNDHCVAGQCESVTECPVTQCKIPIPCDPVTGPEPCPTKNSPDGTPCDDYDPDTKESQCEDGECKEKPIVNLEPDVVELEVEPNPEPDDVDVIEQLDGGNELDAVEQPPEGDDAIDGDDADVAPDGKTDTVDAVEADQEPDSAEAETDVAEREPDTKIDMSIDASEDLTEDGSNDNAEQETGTETESDNSVPRIDEETPGKTPGCSCDVSDTQRQQGGLKEMLSVFGLAALAVLGLRRKKEKAE